MNDAQRPTFRVALTADFYDEAGRPKFADLGLSVFEPHAHVAVANFASHQAVIHPEQINGSNGVVVLTPQGTGKSIAGCADLLAIGRFGVGYDTVDVEACTRANVIAMIAAGAVDRPVADGRGCWSASPDPRACAARTIAGLIGEVGPDSTPRAGASTPFRFSLRRLRDHFTAFPARLGRETGGGTAARARRRRRPRSAGSEFGGECFVSFLRQHTPQSAAPATHKNVGRLPGLAHEAGAPATLLVPARLGLRLAHAPARADCHRG